MTYTPSAYNVVTWQNTPSTSTPLNKIFLEAAEQSLANRINTVGGEVAVYAEGLVKTVTATTQAGTGVSAYTFVLADAGTVVEGTGASAATWTVPPNASVAFAIGTVIEICQMGAGQITLLGGAGVTLRSDGGKLRTGGQYAVIGIRQRATNEWVVSGDLLL